MARSIDRKELKNPDQFVSFWTRVGHSASVHRTKLTVGVLGALTAILLVWAANGYMGRRAANASQAFARIERIANAPLLPVTGDGPAKKAEEGVPQFKTEKERTEAALKEAESFIAANGGLGLAAHARLLKGHYLFVLGKPADAAAAYEQLLGGSLDQRLRFLAQEGLAYAYEAKGDFDRAIASFGAMADESQSAGGFYRDFALFNKARLLEKKGNPKDAEKVFKEILEKAPATSLRDEINDRLAALEGK